MELKPDTLQGINAGNNRIQAMKKGMEQYGKEIVLEKNIIPPFDMYSIEDNYIDLTPSKEDKDKSIDMDV